MSTAELISNNHKEIERPSSVIVMKFGGTSVGNTHAIENVANNIVSTFSRSNNSLVVVVSAMSGVTNKLVQVCENLDKHDTNKAEKGIREVLDQHLTTSSQLKLSIPRRFDLQDQLRNLYKELRDDMENYHNFENIDQAKDKITSYGERLNSRLVNASCQEAGIETIAIDANSLIKTNSTFGSAEPDFIETQKAVDYNLNPLLSKRIVPIITGFIGSSPDGKITTLGRGGSDYTASILGKVLLASEVWIWTDVSGVYNADPRKDADARSFGVMSFSQADKMAKEGSKVLYPKTIEPLIGTKTVIRVKNTFDPSVRGTKIINDCEFFRLYS